MRRDKTDRCDAAALLDAARSATIQAVPVKTATQQAVQALHRVRTQWQTARTARINGLRSVLAEQGIAIRRGPAAAMKAIPPLLDDPQSVLPGYLKQSVRRLVEEIRTLEAQVKEVEQLLAHIAADDPIVARLRQVPGIGVLTATALCSRVGHLTAFRRGRQFASWLGLAPREYSSGRRRSLGRISKRGDADLRSLLVHGARSVIVAAQRARTRHRPLSRLQHWVLQLVDRRGFNIATVAWANKLARMVGAVWRHDAVYTMPLAA